MLSSGCYMLSTKRTSTLHEARMQASSQGNSNRTGEYIQDPRIVILLLDLLHRFRDVSFQAPLFFSPLWYW